MIKKHPSCRWRSEKKQKQKTLLDADVNFFEDRIKQYEELLKIENKENWCNEDMDIKQLCEFFNREDIILRKAIKKMCDIGKNLYKIYIGEKVVISKEGVGWIAKNVFKDKYLELLEKHKMQLTEKYIEIAYPYDNFFWEKLNINSEIKYIANY